jgi:hypothetical protein
MASELRTYAQAQASIFAQIATIGDKNAAAKFKKDLATMFDEPAAKDIRNNTDAAKRIDTKLDSMNTAAMVKNLTDAELVEKSRLETQKAILSITNEEVGLT